MLWLLAPLVLLFSYKREPQNPTMRMMILVAAIRIIVLLYLESGHQAQPMLNIPRMNLEGFVTGETAAEEASGVKFPGIIDGISCRGKDTAFPGSRICRGKRLPKMMPRERYGLPGIPGKKPGKSLPEMMPRG